MGPVVPVKFGPDQNSPLIKDLTKTKIARVTRLKNVAKYKKNTKPRKRLMTSPPAPKSIYVDETLIEENDSNNNPSEISKDALNPNNSKGQVETENITRQEMRAGAALVDEQEMERVGEEMERLLETIRVVREGPPSMPSIALYRVMCEEGLVTSAACDERGAVLGLGSGDSVVRLVDIQPPGEDGGVIDVGFSTIKLGREIGVVNLNVGGGQVRCLRGHSGPVYGVDWLWEGGLLTCGEDRSVRVWDRGTGAGLCVLRGHNYPVWCVRGDGLGLKFVTGSLDRTVRLWMPELGHPIRVYCGHDGSVDCVGWHPNCSYVFSGSSDKTVRMWSYEDGKCVRMLPTGKGGVTAVSCSPDGKLCASGGEDRRVRVWDLASGSVVKELKGHTGEVTNIVWGSDSRLLISGGNDGVLKVWDVGVGGEGECAGSYSCGPGSLLLGLNFTHTNTLVVTATDSGGLQFL